CRIVSTFKAYRLKYWLNLKTTETNNNKTNNYVPATFRVSVPNMVIPQSVPGMVCSSAPSSALWIPVSCRLGCVALNWPMPGLYA
ncbi:hypothetical protein DOY81_011162, partial [Sarcophaga bullata]